MSNLKSTMGVAALAALTAIAAPGFADEPAAAPAAHASTVLNVKVARDQETGQLRAMTAQEEAEFRQNAKAAAPTVLDVQRPATATVVHADGRMTGKLAPESMESLLLVRAPDGKLVMTHDAAAAAAAETATPAPTAEAPTE